MRSFFLLLLALSLMALLFIPLLFIQTCRNFISSSLPEFNYGLALSLDYLGAYLIFGTHKHTISATVWDKDILWAVALINWLFQDDKHCENEWKYEFLIRPNLNTKGVL